MALKASERATLVKEIAKRLSKDEWPLIDATLQAFTLPTPDTWNGTTLSYILYVIKEATDSTLLELAEHVGYITSDKPVGSLPRFWKPNYFRLFITHLASHKKSAGKLKDALDSYVISAFVAHNDIAPTKEWLDEIEVALSSCEALVVLLHPRIHESKWTDQEIGFAMGRGLPVLAVKCGEDPYGFIGKFQAFNANNKDAKMLASELFNALRKGKQTNKRISEALVEGFVESESYQEAIDRMGHLEMLTVWDSSFAARLRLAVKRNRQIYEAFGVPQKVEKLIKKWAKR